MLSESLVREHEGATHLHENIVGVEIAVCNTFGVHVLHGRRYIMQHSKNPAYGHRAVLVLESS